MALLLPAPFPNNIYTLRFYQTGTATANFADKNWLFTHPADATKQAWSRGFRIRATSGTIEFSFDGVNVHGSVASGGDDWFFERVEGGIAVRGNTFGYVIEAW